MPGTAEKLVVLPGSEPVPNPGVDAHAAGPFDPDQTLTVTVTLRPRPGGPSDAQLEAQSLKPPAERAYAGRDAPAADPADVEKVLAFARQHGLRIAESDPSKRRVILEGAAGAFAAAFGVTMARFAHPDGEYRGVTSAVHVPASLAPSIESVLGLDDQPAARPRA